MRTTLCDDIARGWTLPQIARRRRVPIRSVRDAAGLCRDEADDAYLPSRQAITNATAALRSTWSDAERRLRETRTTYDGRSSGYSVKTGEAARILGVDRSWVQRLADAGKLPCQRISHGSRVDLLFSFDDLAAYRGRNLSARSLRRHDTAFVNGGRRSETPGTARDAYHGACADDV